MGHCQNLAVDLQKFDSRKIWVIAIFRESSRIFMNLTVGRQRHMYVSVITKIEDIGYSQNKDLQDFDCRKIWVIAKIRILKKFDCRKTYAIAKIEDMDHCQN